MGKELFTEGFKMMVVQYVLDGQPAEEHQKSLVFLVRRLKNG